MSYLEIKSDEERLISFDLEVMHSSKLPEIRLVIENVNSDFDITIPARFENGIVEAKIPKMENIINEFNGKRRLKAKVEAIIEDTYLVPWEGEIIVEPTVKILAKQKEIKEVQSKPKVAAILKEVKKIVIEKKEITPIKEKIAEKVAEKAVEIKKVEPVAPVIKEKTTSLPFDVIKALEQKIDKNDPFNKALDEASTETLSDKFEKLFL